LSRFDREKFYKRIGVNVDENEPHQAAEPEVEMVEQVCVTEFGSEGFADNQEIAIEKSVDFDPKPRRADLSVCFDYEAFYRKQGVYDSPGQHLAFFECQMTTEEFEQELADQIPVSLTKETELGRREPPPDLVDREAFYRRVGFDVSEKKSEAPTEKKVYSLPAIAPMMSTWTY